MGPLPAIKTAFAVVHDGGVISRVGSPQFEDVLFGFRSFMRNITLTGTIAPARAYIDELPPQVFDGAIQPGNAVDRTMGLDDVPADYRAMADREALQVLIQPQAREAAPAHTC